MGKFAVHSDQLAVVFAASKLAAGPQQLTQPVD